MQKTQPEIPPIPEGHPDFRQGEDGPEFEIWMDDGVGYIENEWTPISEVTEPYWLRRIAEAAADWWWRYAEKFRCESEEIYQEEYFENAQQWRAWLDSMLAGRSEE